MHMAYARALDLLTSGKALAAMERLIAAQGAQAETFRPGAPMDKGAGIDLLRKIDARVRRGEPLYRIHAQSETGLRFACDLAAEGSGYRLLS